MLSFLIAIGIFCYSIVVAKEWEYFKIEKYSLLFHRSSREYNSPVVVWLGSPSSALKVHTKYGTKPLPSAWTSFVNIIYLYFSNISNEKEERVLEPVHLVGALKEWTFQHSLSHNPLFLGGDCINSQGEIDILNVAIHITEDSFWNLAGVLVGSSQFTPVGQFFGHKSFESANKLNFWSLNRAEQPIVCNLPVSEVEFIMNDYKLLYRRPSTLLNQKEEIYEFSLHSVATLDRCYLDIDEFRSYFESKTPLEQDNIVPYLPSPSRKHVYFPTCDSLEYVEDLAYKKMQDLLSSNVHIFSYLATSNSPQLICSFYIGIYENQGYRYPETSQSSIMEEELNSPSVIRSKSVVNEFNSASMEEMNPSWSTDSSSSDIIPGYIKSTIHASFSSQLVKEERLAKAGLTWMQLGTTVSGMSESGAFEILFTLLSTVKQDYNLIDVFVSSEA